MDGACHVCRTENLIQQSFHTEIFEGKHEQQRMQADISGTVDSKEAKSV